MNSIVDIDRFDVIDPRIADKARPLHRVHKWVFFPRGWITEPGGSLLIFDGRLYPLCRKRPDGRVVILPMVEFGHPPIFTLRKPRFLYGSIDHPCDDEETQQRLIGAVQRLGLEEEVYRRYDALHRELAARRRNFRRLICRR
jgi:hypothetical protein